MKVRKTTFISTRCEAIIRHKRAALSFHMEVAIGSGRVILVFVLHFVSNTFKASRYPIWSPAQYFTRACMTSNSNGRRRSNTQERASGGSMPFNTVKRFVHSAEVWLKSRKRARQARRVYQSWMEGQNKQEAIPSWWFAHTQNQCQILWICRYQSISSHLGQGSPAVGHLCEENICGLLREVMGNILKSTHDESMKVGSLPIASEVSGGTFLRRVDIFGEESTQGICLIQL